MVASLNKETVVELIKKYSVMLLLIVFVIIASMVSNSFFTLSNFFNILQSYAAPGIIAIGMTFTILSSGTDLSVGSVAALAGMVSASLLAQGFPVGISIILGIIMGGLLGTITGLIITFFQLEPFIVSLATMVSARGLAMLTTDGKVISGLIKLDGGDTFCYLGGGSFEILGERLPFAGLTWVAITLVMAYILKYTNFGRGLYAIGGNKEAALLSGVRVKLFNTLAWTISGMTAAYGGIMLTSWLTVAQPTLASGFELDAIAAVVIGGTAMTGGKGGVGGTLVGVFILAIITNLFNLMGLPSYYQQIFKGIIIVGALLLNRVVSINEK
ncbi:MAG: ABC transporter permease [Clostridiales Family XIII bacterium]|jgi:ribose transport system permease protein|nr:ABC transporter permease [Clostridiales Family XIII bacterium]